ncbi:MAG: hypothetical protein LBK56_11165 [Gracilibacteraceae bacterium]|jgi:hypothetical protein|nr:hypothetical protein [Gracilibacteraceae bacterium]
MGILAVYDTTSIQNYIFSSNQLAENVGGSKLVADIFHNVFSKVLRKIEPEMPEWRDGGKLNPALQAAIIYQGGGNAYAAFADYNTFQDATKDFLIEANETAPGIGIAVAAVETNFVDYRSDFEILNKRLTSVKGGFNTPAFAGNQPITKQSERTGLPVVTREDDEFLDESQVKKRARYRKYCQEERKSELKDFNELAFEKNVDSLIAIVHADGNSIGTRIKEFMEQEQLGSYTEAVPKMRKLSQAIDACYETALKDTIDAFESAYAGYIAALRAENPGKIYNDKSPILELIRDGDDITFVIGGRFAIDFATRLLREIERQPDPFGNGNAPYACAGVVIFHSHYPFSEAYKLAEELCASAKKSSRDCAGSYIDFHLHQSGNVAGLQRLRERQYMVDRKTILRRPWRITAGSENARPNFKWFEGNARAITKMLRNSKIARNKIKAVRNEIGAGDGAAKLAINQLRDARLPTFPPLQEDGDRSKYAALFDILELYDTYENLLNKEDAANGNE